MPATKADLDNLAAAIQAHDADPWFLALFHAALDATHDAAHALKAASAAYGQHPAQPVGPTGPKAPEAGRFAESDGRWITIGAKGSGENKKGGSPVFVQGGRIIKGAPSLTGKKIGDVKGPADDNDSHRKQLKQSADYARATWGKKARKEGLKPDDVRDLAKDIMEHDKAFKKERTQMLQRARQYAKEQGYGSLQGLNLRAGKGIDADAVKGLDDVAQSMAAEYPEHFHGHDDIQGRLFDLLVEGNPEPISEDDAYEQAFEYLKSQKPTYDDVVPFGDADAVSILTGPVRRLDDPQRFAEEDDAVDLDAEEARLLRRLRRVQEARQDERTARLFREMPPPVVHVNVPAPVVNLPAPVVNVAAPPPVQVNVPAPVVNVAAPPVPRPPKGRVVKFVERDAEGNIVRLVEETE